jgi:poly(hydroxyalkanoate) depolymerase family esterase
MGWSERGSWGRLLLAGVVFAVSGCAVQDDAAERPSSAPVLVFPQSLGAGSFEEVRSFGSNPGALKMYRYSPPSPVAGAGLVVAMHPCTLSASSYRGAGFEELADEHGFYVMYPEQQTANNGLQCFNWAGEYGDPTNLRRGEGENLSIINMVRQMESDFDIDPEKIFAVGHSGGGAEVALMLATWPDVFRGGAVFAGIPYDCTRNFGQVNSCLNPGRPRDANAWGDLVRAAYPEFRGTYPKMSVWHGSADGVVSPVNATELVKQWTDVHGADQIADAEELVDGFPRAAYHNARGETVVEQFTITGAGHGTFVDPDQGCGTAASYLLDNDICAAAHIAAFFGLTGDEPDPGDRTPPTVSLTAPTQGQTVMGMVAVTATATDDVGVASVELVVDGETLESFQAGPFTAMWNTSVLANGAHTVRAVATDAAGNEGVAEVTVTVAGAQDDTTAPTVAITAPVAAATVSGSVLVAADAADDLGLRHVVFTVDGEILAEVAAPPYEATWNAGAVAPGEHRIAAQAIDAAGNTADDAITVMVDEVVEPGTDGPEVEFLNPAAGETVGGVITVRVSGVDADGVTQALLFNGEELIGADYREPFEFLWDTRLVPEGPAQLTARVFDSLGNPGLATLDIVVGRGGDTGPGVADPDGDGTETIRVGKRYWGCGVAPAAPATGAGFALLLALLGLGLGLRRTSARPAAVAVLASLALLAGGASGCQGDDIYIVTDGEGGPVEEGQFGSASALESYLDGQTLVMEDGEIPAYPNGFDENINFGQATQCYHRVMISPLAGRWTVTSDLGTLVGAAEVGDVGTCDHATLSSTLEFVSTAVLIENVAADGSCFDVTMTFPGFGQEGRASLDEAAGTVTMELFFKDQAVGHRCADGAVGSATVTLDSQPFTGDARQTYNLFE